MKRLSIAVLLLFTVATGAFAQESAPAAKPATLQPAHREGEGWWKNRFAEKLKQAEQGPYDIVFVGDSITQRWDGYNKVQLKEFFGEASVLNLGFSGDRTEHVLWRIERMPWEKINPKVFMVMIGTNNTGHSNRDSAENIYAGIVEIVKQLREKAPNAKIMLLDIFPRGQYAGHPMRVKNALVNARLPQLADNKMVFHWDISSHFLMPDGSSLIMRMMPDQLHPNGEGMAVWGNAVGPTLQQLAGLKKGE